ncbi:MAG TPA: hypothetical protein VFQ72_02315 [Candidatus Paceibacterota bacterium]|nr:hypothetical protein [Candidatus Paceibacterota bacterium]
MPSAWFYGLFALFSLMTVGSEPLGWMKNSNCTPGLGCNIGFGGYDALTHFVCGALVATGLLWLSRRHPRWRIFGPEFGRNLLTVLAIAALVGTLWEILEYCFDGFRTVYLHMDLMHPNQAAQPTNADTAGDMLFGLLGAFFATMPLRNHIRTHEH